MIDQGLTQRPAAAATWARLTDAERERVVTYVRHGVAWTGRRRRAKQMLFYLGLGPESVRGYFAPLQKVPRGTGPAAGPANPVP